VQVRHIASEAIHDGAESLRPNRSGWQGKVGQHRVLERARLTTPSKKWPALQIDIFFRLPDHAVGWRWAAVMDLGGWLRLSGLSYRIEEQWLGEDFAGN
jgi:hypothetical protein